MDGIIELPFALPTAVAGIALTHLTVEGGWVGKIFAKQGYRLPIQESVSPWRWYLLESLSLCGVFSRYWSR